MSMHDEYERAISGSSPKKGMSALAWLLTSLGLFVVLGVVGVGFAMNRVAHQMEEMLVGFDYDAGAAAAKVMARMESHAELLSADPEQGLRFLRNLDGDDPTEAFLGKVFEGSIIGEASLDDLEQLSDLAELSELREGHEGHSLHTRDGDVSIDLRRGDQGGSLVIRSDDGTVRLDLRRTEDGGSLIIDSDDGQARIGLRRTESGGLLTVDSDDGSVRFELVRGDEGGQLLVDADDGRSLRLAFGEDAEALPRWVPLLDGMPERPRPVYSLSADRGVLGAAAWEDDVPARAALEAYQARLEDAGYDIRLEHHRNGARFDHGSLWARDADAGRMVFVVAHETDAGTRLLVGYGEETR